MKLLILAAVLAVATAQADTQNFYPNSFTGVSEKGNVMTSGTTPQDVDVEVGTTGINVVLSATTNVSASLQRRTSTGVIIDSETIAIGRNPTSRTFIPPIPFYDIKVSPTAGMTGTNTLHVNVLQSK